MNVEDLLVHWGIKGEVKKLAGYEDLNYHVRTNEHDYLLKISDGPLTDLLQMQIEAMLHLEIETKVHSSDQQTARLLPWQSGNIWVHHYPKTPGLLQELGAKAAEHHLKLATFSHPAAKREGFEWDLAQAHWIQNEIGILDADLVPIARYFLHRYIDLKNTYEKLPKATIHNDLNDYNTLVHDGNVAGFIDYGDMCYSQRVNEVAILLAYGMMDHEDPLDAAAPILRGFTSECPLLREEVDCLYPLIAMRLLVSVVSSTVGILKNPENRYLLASQAPAIKLLYKLYKISEQFAKYMFRNACGLTVIDQTYFMAWTSKNETAAVCDFSPEDSYTLDLSVGSEELGHEAVYNDAFQHERSIQEILRAQKKTMAIGSYDEIRPLYSSDDFTTEGNEGQRWRTVHLGLDFFADAGSEVYAFAAGDVVSLKYNEGDKNYGNTVILKHEGFWTLYGHLSSRTLEHLAVGQEVKAGDLIAWFGAPHENGNWAPHLHFQIILDMMDYKDDFPGVCYVEDRKIWTALSPDPRPFLGLDPRERINTSATKIMDVRSEKLGRSYSLSYEKPLHIVRAHGAYLYDQNGRKYLDCVNNVPHVGHQNIRVVNALSRQASLLNTNTRYLHKNVVELAEKLTATLPSELSVCHFVNSGSEANELALRMARAATGRHGIVAMEHGYHGNTGLCVDISSYKFDGRGGSGQKDFVQLVGMPDPIRSKNYEPFYLDSEKPMPAAFIHESILSCGGQVVMPDTFFADLYKWFRSKEMVMVADEAQTGLGRVGSHMWAFQAEGLRPDIVTIGKPFGNGHPLAAVVCTPEIAEAFANGMEYFNTFGGNPVSCAVGLEVLQVIQEDGLQEHAFLLGQWLLAELNKLRDTHSIIADVRGRGLFLGWEFADPLTLNPLPQIATRFVNEMKRYGVLLSTDGPFHNVIKFKPPMVFSRKQAEYMLNVADKVLSQIP